MRDVRLSQRDRVGDVVAYIVKLFTHGGNISLRTFDVMTTDLRLWLVD